MERKSIVFSLALTFIWLLGGQTVWAQKDEDKEHAGLAKALEDGRPVAAATLLKGEEFKIVTEKLDSREPDVFSAAEGSTAVEESEWDPWESFNEKAFWFNRQFDRFLLKPIAIVYGTLLPDPVKKSIDNALDNLDVVRRLTNNILQLRFEGAGREVARFVINSTVGIAGLFDVAEDWLDIEPSDKDTGLTLGVYGVGHGPYLILPFLPPLTVRDAIGYAADEAMYPLGYFIPLAASMGIYATETISDRSLDIDKYEGVEETAVDLYSAVRNAYFQKRAAALKK